MHGKFALKIQGYNKAVGLGIMGTGIPVPIPIPTVVNLVHP